MRKQSIKIKDLIREEAEFAEGQRGRDASPPEATVATRGHSRTKTLQVRLNVGEYEELEMLAKARGLPISTVARSLLLSSLATSDDASATLARLENDLAALRRTISKA